MAITKIHPIRRTLNRAVRYITDPKKTEKELYVSCYGCNRENIIKEFALTKSMHRKESPVLAQHLIQSFKKDEVTPEEAHAIGRELADRFTEGKHEYIIATHMDKGCIHNHIIFNHIAFTDYSCFHSDSKKLHTLRSLNDEICASHGLSVIKNPSGKGKSYYEWAMDKMNRSYKKRLRDNIDILIPKVSSYDELLKELKKLGYEIKLGKYDSFRLSEQEKFTRLRSLGPGYSKEEIIDRIEHPESSSSVIRKPQSALVRVWKYDQKLGLIENTGNYLVFIQSNYQRQQAAIQDAKKIAATYNLLKEKGIDSVADLDAAISRSRNAVWQKRDQIRDLEDKISDISTMIKYAERADKYRSTYEEYLSSGKDQHFYETHRSEIMLYESSIINLKNEGYENNPDLIESLKAQRSSYEDLNLDLSTQYSSAKADYNSLITARKNLAVILNESRESREKDDRSEQYRDDQERE